MFASGLEGLLRSIGAGGLTELAIVAMGALFVIGLLLGALHRWWSFTTYLPTLLTSVGILGTFAGIIVGLLDFDPEPGRIDGSIAMLLQGLETAFMSSIVGMALSILFRIYLSLPFVMSRDAAGTDDADLVRRLLETTERQEGSIRDLREAIAGIDESSVVNRMQVAEANFERLRSDEAKRADIENRARTRQTEALEAMLRSLTDVDDASLSGQLRTLRQEMTDRHRAMRLGMDEATARLSTIAETGESALAILRSAKPQDVITTLQEVIGAQTETLSARIVGVETIVGQSVGALAQATDSQTERLAESIESLRDRLHHHDESTCTVLGIVVERLEQAGEDRRAGLEYIANAVDGNRTATQTIVDRIGDSESGLATEVRHLVSDVAGLRESLEPALVHSSAQADERNELIRTTDARLEAMSEAARDRHTEHTRQLEHLSELLSRSATETVIAALKDVIRDFNHHITEQFGDNFKELNQAVGRLLGWQTEYRDQMADMRRQFDASVQALSDCEISVGSIRQHTEAIPEQMRELGNVVKTSEQQLAELGRHLAAFETMRDKAVAAVPQVQEIVQTTVRELDASSKQLTSSVETGARNMQQSISESVREFTTSAKAANDSARETAQRTQDEAHRLFNGLEETLKQNYQETSNSVAALIETEFANMQKVRQEECERVMQEMGTALATIAGTFTRDYQQLVAAMRDVIEQRAA